MSLEVGKQKANWHSHRAGTSKELSISLPISAIVPTIPQSPDLFDAIRTMVDNAMKWAQSRGLVRNNEVHGMPEYRVATDWTFANKNLDRTSTKASSEVEVEAQPS